MDKGPYKDFDESKEPNTIWNFIESGGKFEFKQYTLRYAMLGDSDSIYCSIPAEISTDMDEIVDIADNIVDYVNDSYPAFLTHAFNCPASRTHVIQSNREIVASAVFVASKKRYAAKVINDEGKKVNKLKIMGLEIKRSDTPEIVERFLRELIDMILDNESLTHVQSRIDQMKIEYFKASPAEIARPMGCKSLKKYIDMYSMTNSMKGFPYHARAAIYYNSLCSSSDMPIRPGDKIGILYINDRRSSYIAFPLELNNLPKFFDSIHINYDIMWEKAHKKIINYLKSMGWDLASQKAALRRDMFGFGG